MRILTVGNMYPPHHRGGYELVWQSAVDFLRRAGHEVHVLTTGYHAPGAEAPADPGYVHRELEWYWRDDAWPRISPLNRLRLERANAKVLERRRRALRPDVVCWWAMGGMSLSMIEQAERAGCPEAFVVCDDWLLYGPDVDGWIRAMERLGASRRLVGALTRLPVTLSRIRPGPALFLSETVRERAHERGWRFPETSVARIGVSRSLFREAPAHPWRGRLTYVGRLDPRKGVEVAIRALEHLDPKATLALISSGDNDPAYVARLRELVAELNLIDRVRFAAPPRSELPGVYASSDVVVFPVLWKEPWGLVPLEAMAVGTPVVATGRGGSGEYLRDRENCLIFDPDGGPSALARAVLELAGDADLRARLRNGGQETTERFGEHDFDGAVARLLDHASASVPPS